MGSTDFLVNPGLIGLQPKKSFVEISGPKVVSITQSSIATRSSRHRYVVKRSLYLPRQLGTLKVVPNLSKLRGER